MGHLPTEDQLQELQRLLKDPDPVSTLRARIVLETASGKSDAAVARELGTTRTTVSKWRQRFLQRGIEGLRAAARPGAPRRISDDAVAKVIGRTVDALPPRSHRWTVRSMAAASAVSPMMIQRIWQKYGLNPSRYGTFTITPDQPVFAKVHKILGLYLHPPYRALVLGGARPSRTEPVRRNADAMAGKSLVAGLDEVCRGLPPLPPWRRVVVFRRFLDAIVLATRGISEVHLVLYGFPMHEALLLAASGRWHLHFTPTNGAWVDQVAWYWMITKDQKLIPAIKAYLVARKEEPEPFVWAPVV